MNFTFNENRDAIKCNCEQVQCTTVFSLFWFTVGGWTQTAPLCAVERFSSFYNEWRAMAPMLKRRGDVAVCSLGGMIFTVGGRDDVTCVKSVEK